MHVRYIGTLVLWLGMGSALMLLHLNAAGSTPDSDAKPKVLKVVLKKDMLLSIINPKTIDSDKAKAALKVYYDKAIPLAQSYGYKNHGALRVTETLVGKDQPGVFVLTTWPSEEADLTFESHPDWQQYKALRPVIWEKLNFYKSPSSTDKALYFSGDKFYTVAFAWLNQANPQDYHEYMQGISSSVEAVGGRFIHSMKNPRYVSHTDQAPGPDQITFVEWDSVQALEKFRGTDGFKQYQPYLSSGTTQFRLYRIQPVIR